MFIFLSVFSDFFNVSPRMENIQWKDGKIHENRREVSPAIRVLSCGTIKERHGAEDDPTTPTADLLASDFTVY